MLRRSGAVLGVVLLAALAACGGGSTPDTTPSKAVTSTGTSATPSPTPSATPTVPALKPTVTVGGVVAFGVPEGWVVARSEVQQGSGSVCLYPKGDTQDVFGCAGVVVYFGKHLPGANMRQYAANQTNGWYHATDVEPCPFVKQPEDGDLVGINLKTGTSEGLKPVGKHKASWNKWTAACGGKTFHPQAWFLPTSRVLVFDYLDHPQTAALLASAVFKKDGASLPAAPTYLSAHVISGSSKTMIVQPFRTLTNGPAAKAYAAAHGLEYPFPDDYADVDFGPKRTIAIDAGTACLGGLDLGQDLTGVDVDCAEFGAHGEMRLPAGFWLRPGTSTAESVTEIFRP